MHRPEISNPRMQKRPAACLALLMLISSISLSACYRQWPQVDDFASKVNCHDTKASLIALAKTYPARVIKDNDSHSIQIQKEADTVVIQFDKNQTITRVSVFKVKLILLGLHRRQLTPFTLLDCTKKNA